jgi:hypothetical protein
VNKFNDIADLDAIALQEYSPALLVEMSQRLADLVQHINVQASPLDVETAQHLIMQAKMGGVSLPRLVNQATLGFLAQQDDAEEEEHELGL